MQGSPEAISLLISAFLQKIALVNLHRLSAEYRQLFQAGDGLFSG
jgi:hypothetical protein